MTRRWLIAATALLAACSDRGRALSAIRLVPMETLGADSGDGAIATTPIVSARHPNGFRVVTSVAGAISSPALVFDDRGAFLGALRGGPPRARSASQAMFVRIGPGDSLWVFDNTRHVEILDRARNPAREIQLAAPPASDPMPPLDAVVLGDGRIATIADKVASIQLFDRDGRLARTIGPPSNDGTPPVLTPRIAEAPDGTIWTSSRSGPWRIEHWDTAGRSLGVFELGAAWLVDSSQAERVGRRPSPEPRLPPAPMVQAIWIDTRGRLWVLGRVADRRWQHGVVDGDSTAARHVELDKYYDTIVEVRDTRSGAVIATARFDIACESIAEPGVLVHEVLTRAGWVRAELLRIQVDETALTKR